MALKSAFSSYAQNSCSPLRGSDAHCTKTLNLGGYSFEGLDEQPVDSWLPTYPLEFVG